VQISRKTFIGAKNRQIPRFLRWYRGQAVVLKIVCSLIARTDCDAIVCMRLTARQFAE
jgi:hypothetical protein